MLYSQEKEDVAVPKCEKKALSDVPREKCNETEVPAETSETFDDEHFAAVNGSHNLAAILTCRRTVLSLTALRSMDI